MRLIRGRHNLSRYAAGEGCVATIGNFDGVHLGHRAIIQQLKARADAFGLPACVVIFEPQPLEFFRPEVEAGRLSTLSEKLALLQDAGVDQVLVLGFNQDFAELSAEAFVEQILVRGLRVRQVVVGDDFCFGRGREGNFRSLCEMGKRCGDESAADGCQGFAVADLHSVCIDGERVSSTRIRECLKAGDLAAAQRFLGRPFSITGRVFHGDKRGRTIGFPTANIALRRRHSPVRGVYAVRAWEADGSKADSPVSGVANIGHRPTVNGTRHQLEVHLFDFDADIYGQRLRVELCQRLRDEQRFESIDDLVAQIGRDADAARGFFAKHEASKP